MKNLEKTLYSRSIKTFLITLAIALVVLGGCKDDENETPDAPDPDEEHIGMPTPVGAPAGEVENFTIGPEGGVAKSSDGAIEINIPEGALSASTTIGIQPVENMAPNGIDGGYRLTPHMEFEKPVTIAFKYEEAFVPFIDGLGVAFHGEDDVWYWPGNLSLNRNNHTVSVQTTHFSDWALFESMWLLPYQSSIAPGEKIGFIATGVLSSQAQDDLLTPLIDAPPAPLGEPTPLESKYIKEWKLIGEGKLTPSGNEAAYEAPAAPPANNPVVINLEVNLGDGSKSILLAYVTVGQSEVTLNGGPYEQTSAKANLPAQAVYSASENYTSIGFAALGENGKRISVSLYFFGRETGERPWSENCGLATTDQEPFIVGSFVSEQGAVHQGYVKIDKYGDGVVWGSFAGNLTFTEQCGQQCPLIITQGTVEGSFIAALTEVE